MEFNMFRTKPVFVRAARINNEIGIPVERTDPETGESYFALNKKLMGEVWLIEDLEGKQTYMGDKEFREKYTCYVEEDPTIDRAMDKVEAISEFVKLIGKHHALLAIARHQKMCGNILLSKIASQEEEASNHPEGRNFEHYSNDEDHV